MSTQLTTKAEISPEERALLVGDLKALSQEQRSNLYMKVCSSLGLNPLTQPFQYLELNGRLQFYASRNCTDQLRQIHNISLKIASRDRVGDTYIVTAQATTPQGRVDESTGAVTIGHLKGDALANSLMKCECVPLDYEMLTRDGFKHPLDLAKGELVASVDPSTLETRWSNLEDISIFENQEVTRHENSAVEFEITTGHRWIIEKSNGSRELLEFEKINSGHKILMIGNSMLDKGDLDLSPKQAAALGWIVTDGTIKKYKRKNYRASICQSKTKNFDSIEWALSEMNPTRGITDNREHGWLDQHWWYLSKDQTEKLFGLAGFESKYDLPKIVSRLSPDAREAMLDAMMRADGDDRHIFGKTDPNVVEAVQIMFALSGSFTSRIRERMQAKATKPIFLTKKMSYRYIAKQNLEKAETRRATVWCPTTGDGTWICRTDQGQVFVTGNTKAKRRVTLSICGLSLLDETELDTVREARHVPMEPIKPTPQIRSTTPPPQAMSHDPPLSETGDPGPWEKDPPPMPPHRGPKTEEPDFSGGYETYTIPFGKYAGKRLDQIGVHLASQYADWLRFNSQKSGKELSDGAMQFCEMLRDWQMAINKTPEVPPEFNTADEIQF